jgi:excisionase family DNA binding protein/PAS domain S-box-containing protein
MSSSTLTTEFLLGFLESYPAAVSVFDLDGRMVFVNEHGCDLFKKSKTELIGTHVQDFVSNPALVEGFIGRIILKGYLEGKISITQSDGNTVNVHLVGVLVKDSTGRPMGIVGMARGADMALDQSGEVESAVQRILSQLPDARMLTVEEVAGELRVSKETVRRWVRSGQLPCIKLPRGIRIPSEVIKDLIRTNLQQEAAQGNGVA